MGALKECLYSFESTENRKRGVKECGMVKGENQQSQT